MIIGGRVVATPPLEPHRPPEVLSIANARAQLRVCEAVLAEAEAILAERAALRDQATTRHVAAETDRAELEERFARASTAAAALEVTRARLVLERASESRRQEEAQHQAAERKVQVLRDEVTRARREIERSEALERAQLSKLRAGLASPAARFARAVLDAAASLDALLQALAAANTEAAAARALDVPGLPDVESTQLVAAILDAFGDAGTQLVLRDDGEFAALRGVLALGGLPIDRRVGEVLRRLANVRATPLRAGEANRSGRLRSALRTHRTLAGALAADFEAERGPPPARPAQPIPHLGPTAEELERRFAPAPAPPPLPREVTGDAKPFRPVARLSVEARVQSAGAMPGWSVEVPAESTTDSPPSAAGQSSNGVIGPAAAMIDAQFEDVAE